MTLNMTHGSKRRIEIAKSRS